MADNPKAFPRALNQSDTQTGMTLRDYFAGQALTGQLACSLDDGVRATDMAAFYEHHAKLAYGYADAMLAAREK
jgi:hypothetical protein